MRRRVTFIFLLLAVLFVGVAAQANGLMITQGFQFSGYSWAVKSGAGLGPGPNNWSASNAFVDSSGYLHLKITNVGGTWYCSEVILNSRLGFGTYQFFVTGRIDTLDQNVVLGIFGYPTPDVGADGSNEIDIEYSRFGNPAADIGNYTVYPPTVGAPTGITFPVILTGPDTTQRYNWQSSTIVFQSLAGYVNDNTGQYETWTFAPGSPLTKIPQQPLQIHLNMWLKNGNAPTNGNPVEIIIRSFTFTP